MSVDKQSKGNWRLALIGVILVSIITIEFLGITPLDFNQAKNSVINIVKNINWGVDVFFSFLKVKKS